MQALINSKNQYNKTSSFYKQLPANIICFSHLRWDFVFQRPQHLMTRLSKHFNITFIEEPVLDTDGDAYYACHEREDLLVIVPHLPKATPTNAITVELKSLLDSFMMGKPLANCTFWYYTPMALEFSRKYQPELIVYDCMDELSAFKFAPQSLKDLEKELLKKADIVFTGGQSLYEAKKDQHANIHPFPSSIEKKHFQSARAIRARLKSAGKNDTLTLGFYGVIDERLDIELIKGIADARPNWQIVLLGPVVKIDPAQLPTNKNIKYPGPKNYQELPAYLAEWDIALIPFLLNESTKFISPTKTPEYLAAGVPVISTAIRDVVNPYGKNKLVKIAGSADEFVTAIEEQLNNIEKESWLLNVDDFLSQNSWDNTCSRMLNLMTNTIANRAMSSIAQ
ncbi:glycosyltransferase family 1 protein [Inquilinus sp. KBS0705]|nr:glycosyltransferase family 1 protein [Inquilinus sp. KBS0705]